MKIRRLVMSALLIALNVVLSRLVSINAANYRISISFITVFFAAYLYGWKCSALVAGAGDLIGALLFPTGAFNPFFTLSAMIGGIVYGIFLYHNESVKKALIVVIINQLVISLGLNTFLISYFYNMKLLPLFITRVGQCVVMMVVEFVVINAFMAVLPRIKKQLNEEI